MEKKKEEKKREREGGTGPTYTQEQPRTCSNLLKSAQRKKIYARIETQENSY